MPLYETILVCIIAISIAVLIGWAIMARAVPLGLYTQALVSGAPVGIFDLIGMRLRGVDPKIIVYPRIAAVKAGIPLSTAELETHYLARGNVSRVVQALISADKAEIRLSFQRAAAIDLAGRDVLEAVRMTVNPKVITTPTVVAMAKDGIQLKTVARVTVRANIDKLVGGAGEETVVARVGEGIVSTIGAAESHKSVLEQPDLISRTVLAKGLDEGTAFEILSIDIADIDVGENIGAKLQMDQAEADKNIAQAKAESRRAMAVAHGEEMKAKAEEAQSKVIHAEAEIPLALSEALRKGQMGVSDYYGMRNSQADTEMRTQFAKIAEGLKNRVEDSPTQREV